MSTPHTSEAAKAACADKLSGTPARPIFIIGAPRSGTSILTWCLGQHANILPLEETSWIGHLSRELFTCWRLGSSNGVFGHLGSLGWQREDFLEKFGAKIDEIIFESKLDRIRFGRKHSVLASGNAATDDTDRLSPAELMLRVVRAVARDGSPFAVIRSVDDPKTRWVDGTPENTFFTHGLRALFPEARFIHLLRNPNSVARSLMNFSSVGATASDMPEDRAYAEWQRFVSHAQLAEQAFGANHVLRVLYEELVVEPEKHLRRMLEWLGERYEAACLLPLGQKINSSRKGHELQGGTVEQESAEELYRRVLAFRIGKPSPAAARLLAKQFLHSAA